MRRFLFALASLALAPTFALAENVALIVANGDYAALPDVRGNADIVTAAEGFESRDVTLFLREDARTGQIFNTMETLEKKLPETDRLLVVLSGRMVFSNAETWILPVNYEPGPFSRLGRQAFPLSSVLSLMQGVEGGATLIVATDGVGRSIVDRTEFGIGPLAVPDDVTVLVGDVASTARLLENRLTKPDLTFIEEAEALDFELLGRVDESQTFLPPEPRSTSRSSGRLIDRLQDIRAWRSAADVDTVQAYRGYLRDFPDGRFVTMAQNRIDALTDTPEARAERAEQSLDLSRDARREIQRDLTLLGYGTRGIDGIFGPGTRSAITSWQRDNGMDATGFLSREQLDRLAVAADRRAAELEIEAERRRVQQIQQDRAYWDESGALGTERGYRDYLRRYPDGEFADVAEDRLLLIEQQKTQSAEANDRRLWNNAARTDTSASYRAYLERSPNGAFREEAEARLAAIEDQNRSRENRRAAEATEKALGLSAGTRRLIEARLAAMELQPGAVDGNFDKRTRRAIRRYQETRDLPRTGYLSEAVIIRLLADSVRSFN